MQASAYSYACIPFPFTCASCLMLVNFNRHHSRSAASTATPLRKYDTSMSVSTRWTLLPVELSILLPRLKMFVMSVNAFLSRYGTFQWYGMHQGATQWIKSLPWGFHALDFERELFTISGPRVL